MDIFPYVSFPSLRLVQKKKKYLLETFLIKNIIICFFKKKVSRKETNIMAQSLRRLFWGPQFDSSHKEAGKSSGLQRSAPSLKFSSYHLRRFICLKHVHCTFYVKHTEAQHPRLSWSCLDPLNRALWFTCIIVGLCTPILIP